MSPAKPECAFDPRYGMVVLDYDGIAWGPPTTVELVEAVKLFPCDSSDVLVTAFPKSGTNWMQIMLANLYDDWGTCAITPHRRVPQLEYDAPDFEGHAMSLAARPPRLMKCHLPADRMPHAWYTERSKVIYMARNPKDVCVSFRHQLQALGSQVFDGDWPSWVERFAAGRTIYGAWLDHVTGWRRLGPADGVLHVTYEAMRRDPAGTMRRVIEFIGKPVEPGRFERVVEAALFENMKASGLAEQINVGVKRDEFMRKGEVGDWKNWFTPAQSALFDTRIDAPLRAAGIALEYE
ncbi:MAG: sulfotransferase domain-containing protein [Gammaproteobacteria bacterium]